MIVCKTQTAVYSGGGDLTSRRSPRLGGALDVGLDRKVVAGPWVEEPA